MCGIVGVVSFTGQSVVWRLLNLLMSLQNRGQDSVGFAISNTANPHQPSRFWKEADSAEACFGRPFVAEILARYEGNLGIGHVRYATASERDQRNAQPHYFDYGGNNLLVVSNGDIPYCRDEREALKQAGFPFASNCDAEVLAKMLGKAIWSEPSGDLRSREEQAFIGLGSSLQAAFSMAAITPSKRLFVMRDPYGIRPLWWTESRDGKLFLACSESARLEAFGPVNEVQPGTLMIVSADHQIRTIPFARARCRFCLMEIYYFSRPDSRFKQERISEIRHRLGIKLAAEWREAGHPLPDLVTAVPQSGNLAAQGCAQALGVPYRELVMKDRFSRRIFQQNEQERRTQIEEKFHIDTEAVRGKKVLVVDDSIVRGDQAKVIARKLQEAGTSSVFYASTAPPYINTCYLGINTPDRHRLVAFGCTPELVRQKIGAEVLHYLSLESSFEVLGSRDFCTGCFTGQYPVPVPEESQPEV